jgi:hypothetical protein
MGGAQSITATTYAPGFEAPYVGNSNPGVVWRSTGITENTIDVSFLNQTQVKGVVVLTHNLEAGDTFAFEASNDGFGNVLQTVNIDPADGFKEVTWPAGYLDYRVRMAKNSGSYIQVGEVYLFASSYQFERNFKWNYTYTREINRNTKQTTSGQVYRTTRFIRKGFNLDFEGINDAQRQTFEDISESDYICFLPTGSDGELYYGVVDFSSFTHVYSNFWDASMTFMENPE